MDKIKNDKSFHILKTKNVKEFTEIYNSLQSVNGEMVIPNIIAKFDLMKEIANTLVRDYDYNFYSTSFTPEEINGYNHEYLLSVDENKDIWIEPILIGSGYLNPAYISFIHCDCNSKIVTTFQDEFFIPFEISPNS